MLISKTVKVKMSWTNKRYIIALNKEFKFGDMIEINVEDLWNGCNVPVEVYCDYCLENGINSKYITTYSNYIRGHIVINKDTCKKCKALKTKESNIVKYGVDNVLKLDSYKKLISDKNKKYTKEFVISELSKKGYVLIGDYVNSTTDFNYTCEKHREFGMQKTTFSKFIDNNNCCTKCIGEEISNIQRKYSLNEVKQIFMDNNCELLNDEYKNQNQELRYVCNNHKYLGVQVTKMSYIESKGWICNYCIENSTGFKFNINYIKTLFSSYDLELVDNQMYINSYSDLFFICNNHPEVSIQSCTLEELNRNGNKVCDYCNNELKEVLFLEKQTNFFKEMINAGMIPLETSEYIDVYTPIEYRCIYHPKEIQKITPAKFRLGRRCKFCAIEKNKGSTHYNWQGGISELNLYLRGLLRPFIAEKLKDFNYKCDITGFNGTLEVHHLYNFNKIVKESLKELNLPIKANVLDYSEEELCNLECLFLSKHKNNWGVPILPKLHDLFHKEYGLKDNNKNQYIEFKRKYLEHDYDNKMVK